MRVQTNDALLTVYVASVVRAVLALHKLILNKIGLREEEDKDKQSSQENGKEDTAAKDESKAKAGSDASSK